MTTFDFDTFQSELMSVARTAIRAGDAFAGLPRLHRHTEEILTAQLGTDHQIACAAGCGTCCIVNVAVLYPEVLLMAKHIDNCWTAAQKHTLLSKLRELSEATRWLDDEERLFLRKPCVFLDENASCTIHPLRPLLCRSVNSIDAEQCHDAIVAVVFGESPLIIANLFQKQLYEEAFTGIARALNETQLPNTSGRLSAVLGKFLSVSTTQRTPQLFAASCRP